MTIGLNGRAIGEDAASLTDIRSDLFELIGSGEFDCVTSVKVVLRRLLGLLSSAHEQGCEVELLNPSQELQGVVRNAKLDAWVLMRGATA